MRAASRTLGRLMESQDVRAKRHFFKILWPPILRRRKLRCRRGCDLPEATQGCLEGPGERVRFFMGWPFQAMCSWRERTELCKGVCVSLRANRHFQLIWDTHHEVVTAQGPTSNKEQCRLQEGPGWRRHQPRTPYSTGGWEMALAQGRTQKKWEKNCERHTLVSKQRDKTTSRPSGEESRAGEGSMVSS